MATLAATQQDSPGPPAEAPNSIHAREPCALGSLRRSPSLDRTPATAGRRGRGDRAAVVDHALQPRIDRAAQFTSVRYGERVAEIGAVPSIGTIGGCDNALAETVNGYYKSELIYGPTRTGPWTTVEDVELATLGWVHWHNTARLHGYLNDVPPTEFEAAFYDAPRTDQPLVGIQ